MNANDLAMMMGDDKLLQEQESRLLEQLAEKYPYFFIAHALLAKKNSSEQKHSQQSLNAAALLAGNREMLYHFISEKMALEKTFEKPKEEIAAPFRQKELTVEERDNEELMEMLKSIHERKIAFLESGNFSNEEKAVEATKPVEEIRSDANEQFELSEASIADSEFPMNNIFLEEENAEMEESLSSEIEAMHGLDSEMSEQAEFELQEDLLLTNEISGGGAEFIPTEFLNSEDANEEFALEPDAEIQSMNVFEKEFVFHDPERDLEETEVEVISMLEKPLKVESENLISFYAGDVGGEEISSIEIPEKEISQQQSLHEQPSETEIQPIEAVGNEGSDLRINEHVASPGEFLPDKSYTYSQWLKFFKSDKAEKKFETPESQERKELPKAQETERSFGATMQLELESIDRIVSSINIKTENLKQEISAEELAKKSLDLNEEVVSETLARIYEDQGRYDKAIRQYVKLSLIYPQKVSFFAARIKELKGKK